MSTGSSDVPIAMCLTQFHCLVMYRDRLEAVCVLNEKVVFQESHSVRVSVCVCLYVWGGHACVCVCVRACAYNNVHSLLVLSDIKIYITNALFIMIHCYIPNMEYIW